MQWLDHVFNRLFDVFQYGWYVADPHALVRQAQRGIDDYEVEDAICRDFPEVIKTYPNYWQGPAVLVRGEVHSRVLHIFCTVDSPPLFVTCYWPDQTPDIWYPGYRKKRRCQQ